MISQYDPSDDDADVQRALIALRRAIEAERTECEHKDVVELGSPEYPVEWCQRCGSARYAYEQDGKPALTAWQAPGAAQRYKPAIQARPHWEDQLERGLVLLERLVGSTAGVTVLFLGRPPLRGGAMIPKPGEGFEGFYVTRAESPFRAQEEADTKGDHVDTNGNLNETKPERAREARECIDADELDLELVERLELRCSTPDLERWRDAARARGLSVSAFLRLAAREHALHPALRQGLYGAALELGRHAVQALQDAAEALQRGVSELADLGEQLRNGAAPRKKAKPNLEMKHANRQRPAVPRGRR